MVPDSDKDTFTERLVTAPKALLRWVAPASKPGDGEKASALGCLNPLTLIRIVVLLLLVVLMPLYMLPLMLARIATFGRDSVSYASAIDMTSGEPARLGYGALDPPAARSSVQAGLAAIAAHDPAFNPAKLVNWATTATGLIRQSLISADATPTRTFMANALFRTYLALLELRVRAGVAYTASWRVTDSAIVEAVSTPLFDEVRVRVQCQGWSWEQHGATGLTLRGGQQQRTWSEDLTFGRSAHATSPAAGGLAAGHCPSCGAPLDLDHNGACRYCRGIVTAGRHDWVLTNWRREPW